MSGQDRTRQRQQPSGDDRAVAADEAGKGKDVQRRSAQSRPRMDVEQKKPLFDSTIAKPEPLPGDLDAPEGIESLGQFSRDSAEPADAFIEDLLLDDEDAEPS